MSKDFINPPCKRFRRTTYDNMGFNTVRAHHSLTKDGCSRLESLKYLARANCKMDATINWMGPKNHNILKLRHDKYLCVNGWDYSESRVMQYLEMYDTKEPNNDQIIEQIRQGDEMLLKLEQLDDQRREQNLYNFGYQARFLKLLTEQFKLPEDKNQKIDKILALKKQMRKMNKSQKSSKSKVNILDEESYKMESSSRMMSSTKRSVINLPINSEQDSVIQKCETEHYLKTRETESPNIKSITDFKNKIFCNYIRRVSKQSSQPNLLPSRRPSKNILLNSGIQLRESKTRVNGRDQVYYQRNVFFPTEQTVPKHNSLQQSQYQF